MSNSPFFFQQYNYENGLPLSGGKLYFYLGGSSSLPKAVYNDYELTIEAPNPIILSSEGICQDYFFGDGYYRVELYSAEDELIFTRDYVSAVGSTSAVDSYKVKVDEFDDNPRYISDKIIAGEGIENVVYVTSDRYLQINSLGKINVQSGDEQEYLKNKLVDSSYIKWGVVTSGSTYKLSATIDEDNLKGDGKVKVNFVDSYGYLDEKIATGYGIALEETVTSAGGYLTLSLSDDVISAVGKVYSDPNDKTAQTLIEKMYADPGVYITSIGDGIDNTLHIGSLGYVSCLDEDDILGTLNNKLASSDTITLTSAWDVDKGAILSPELSTSALSNIIPNVVKAGSGIVINETTDATYGTVLWISSQANYWSATKSITTSTYTLLDSDSIVVCQNGCSITLPTPSSSYNGRKFVVASGGSTVTVTISNSSVVPNYSSISNYGRSEFVCYLTNLGYRWVQK